MIHTYQNYQNFPILCVIDVKYSSKFIGFLKERGGVNVGSVDKRSLIFFWFEEGSQNTSL